MEEIVIKLEVPSELREEFRAALAKALKKLVIDIEFSLADAILSKSTLTDEKVDALSSALKERVAKRHGL